MAKVTPEERATQKALEKIETTRAYVAKHNPDEMTLEERVRLLEVTVGLREPDPD